MNILAINTAFLTANLALSVADKAYYADLDANCKHSENVLKNIDALCQQANVDIGQIDVVSVVVGPGSFTGLRIGAAIAKALFCANNKIKLISLSSLDFMAYTFLQQNKAETDFVCALNALSDLFFVATYNQSGIKLQQEQIIDKPSFENLTLPVVCLQDDLPLKTSVNLTSQALLAFTKAQIEAKNFVSIDAMVPKYLRLSQAEDNLLKNLKKV